MLGVTEDGNINIICYSVLSDLIAWWEQLTSQWPILAQSVARSVMEMWPGGSVGIQTGYIVGTEPGKTSWREASLHHVLLGQSQAEWRKGIVSRGSSRRKTKAKWKKLFLALLWSYKKPSVPWTMRKEDNRKGEVRAEGSGSWWRKGIVGFYLELVMFSVKNKAIYITGLLSHMVSIEPFDSATVAQE